MTETMTQACSEPGCLKPAEFSYIWPWGDQGVCCGAHRLTLDQRARQQIKRGALQFSVLNPNAAPAITRDERTQLKARIYTLEEEAKDWAARCERLNQHAQQASDSLGRATTREFALTQELAEVKRERDLALDDAKEARVAAGRAIAERDRLQTTLQGITGPRLPPPPGSPPPPPVPEPAPATSDEPPTSPGQ